MKLIVELRANENATRAANRNVPWSPSEIAEDAARCREAGASIIHYHGRNSDGSPSHDPDVYTQIAQRIRDASDILLAPSLANVPGASTEERLANISPGFGDGRIRPDFLAIEPGSTNMDQFDRQRGELLSKNRTFVNTFETVEFLAQTAASNGLLPYLTSFNVTWSRAVETILDIGLVPSPSLLLFVMGGPSFIAAHPATRQGLEAHLAFLPQGHDIHWLVCCHGANALEVAELAIERGGHVAIGLGDHPYDEHGEPSNADLIEQIVATGRRFGREPATPREVKAMLAGPTSLGPEKV